MKLILTMGIFITGFFSISKAQTAMQISGEDCYGEPVDMFADLDAGKAIILHFYMPDCGACPPPAEKIQEMASNIMMTYPDAIKGYAFPFQNSTTCEYSASWVEENHVEFYSPMDSGAVPVAYYGGFGMPTIVLLGGADHRVMFSTLSFATADTTEMRDSILNMLGAMPTDIYDLSPSVSNLNLFPNPAKGSFEIAATILESTEVQIEIQDLSGMKVSNFEAEPTMIGAYSKTIDTGFLPNGIYFVKLITNANTIVQKVTIVH